MVLNLPVNSGLEVIGATVSGGETTQMVIVPLTRVGTITNGQVTLQCSIERNNYRRTPDNRR